MDKLKIDDLKLPAFGLCLAIAGFFYSREMQKKDTNKAVKKILDEHAYVAIDNDPTIPKA